MARRRKNATKVKASKPPQSARITHRTVTDLPQELLHMVFAHLRETRSTISIKACTQVCRLLRDVAVEYLVFKSPNVRDLDHFMSFMRMHSPLRKTVRSLTLSHTSLDASVVRELAQHFPNVKSLTLEDIFCASPLSPYPHAHSSPTLIPLHLDKVVMFCTRVRTNSDPGWSLSGMMHILSLLAPQEILIAMSDGVRFRDKFDPTCLASFPAVRTLRVRLDENTPKDKKSIANLLKALSRTLAPDVLESVTVDYDWKATLRALSTLLKRIGGNVRDLTIVGSAPRYWDDRQFWVDPFDDWTLVDIRECKKLESLTLPTLLYRSRENLQPQRALSHVAAGLLANYAPSTLRKFAIEVRDFTCPVMLENRAVLDLQEFDKVLTQARFPNLERFVLEVSVRWDLEDTGSYVWRCREAARRALPGLHSRGALKFRVEWR